VQARAGSPFCGALVALAPPCLTANVDMATLARMTEIRTFPKWPLTEAELKQAAAEMHEQSVKRQQMKRALRSVMTPIMGRAGFIGTCPRYRRLRPERYDLLMFDFNRFEDFFSIQIGQCAPDDWGEVPHERLADPDVVRLLKKIDPEYLRFEQRARVQPGQGLLPTDFFQYGDAKTPDDCRRIALSVVPFAVKAIAGFDDFRRFAHDNKLDRR
jgi:hypothetical protein